jgi:hypothetical protein
MSVKIGDYIVDSWPVVDAQDRSYTLKAMTPQGYQTTIVGVDEDYDEFVGHADPAQLVGQLQKAVVKALDDDLGRFASWLYDHGHYPTNMQKFKRVMTVLLSTSVFVNVVLGGLLLLHY